MAKRSLKSLNHSKPIHSRDTCIVSAYFVFVIVRHLPDLKPQAPPGLGALLPAEGRGQGWGLVRVQRGSTEAQGPKTPSYHLPKPISEACGVGRKLLGEQDKRSLREPLVAASWPIGLLPQKVQAHGAPLACGGKGSGLGDGAQPQETSALFPTPGSLPLLITLKAGALTVSHCFLPSFPSLVTPKTKTSP